MGFGFGNFGGGMVQGFAAGLQMLDAYDKYDERQREQQLAKDSAAAFSKIGKDDDQGFVDSGGQIKVGDQQFNDMATAKKFASDKDLAAFATDGASDPANAAPTPAPAPAPTPAPLSTPSQIPDQDAGDQSQAPAPMADQGAAMPTDPSAITQTKLATPLPVQTLDKAGKPTAMKTYGMQDYLNYRAQRAGELGLGQQATEAMANALANRFSNAAMKAYTAGDYQEVYRLHNVLPDGYTVKREVIPPAADGTGGGIRLSMVNDKTGELYGQPMKFDNDREAAGAFVAAAQKKLPEWLIAQGKQDNDVLKMMYRSQMSNEAIQQRRDAANDRNMNQMMGLLMRGDRGGAGGAGGSGGAGGGAKGDLAYGNDPRMSFAERWIKDGKGADGQPVGTATQFQFMDNAERIGKNHPELSPAALSSVAYGATVHPEGVKPEVNPSTGDLMLTYRDPAYNTKDGNNVSQPYILQRSITPEMARQQGFDDKTMAKAATAVVGSMPTEKRQALDLAASSPDQMKAAQQAIMDGYKQKAEQEAAANPAQAGQIRAVAAQKASQDIAALSRNADWYRIYKQSQPVAPASGTSLKQPGGLQGGDAYVKPQYSADELATARKYGVEQRTPLWQSIKETASDLGGAMNSYGGSLRDNAFARSLRAFRSGDQPGVADNLAEMAKGNPKYLQQLTPDDLKAIEVATGIKL